MDKSTPFTERAANASSRSRHYVDASRFAAATAGLAEQADVEMQIDQGGQAIEAMGDDLGRAAEGLRRDVDVDDARQRLRDCQATLVGMGYSLGEGEDPVDGITGFYDAATRSAVVQFQEDNDLPGHGRLDRETYEALLRGAEQAMSMRTDELAEDEAGSSPNEAAMGHHGREQDAVQAAEQLLDDSNATLIDLQDDLDAGTAPSELEDF